MKGYRMRGWRRVAWRRRVIVNLRSGGAIVGVLRNARGGVLELAQAMYHPPGGTPVALDGSAIIDTANVDFAQVLPSVTPHTVGE